MNLRLVVLTAGLSIAAFGCSVTTTPAGSGDGMPASDPGTPVKSQPLAGTINGKPFTGAVALAHPGSSGSKKSVEVYGADATCDKPAPLATGDHKILVSVDGWTDGSAYELDLNHSLTFVEEPGNNFITFSGRVEVVKAGTNADPGTLRIRANDGDKGSVEGEVKVLSCAN
jgi:hypothetical protein